MGASRIKTENYRYRICIQDPTSRNPEDLLVTYQAKPVSLQTSVHEIQDERLCLVLTDEQVQYCQNNCIKVKTNLYNIRTLIAL